MKVCLWTATDWAFGRIANAIKQYSRHDITIIEWSHKKYDWDKFDLIYVTVWYVNLQFHQMFKTKTPTCHSVHGVAELFNIDPGRISQRSITESQVEKCLISDEVRTVLNKQKTVGCVSREIINLLRSQVSCKLVYTPYGVGDEFFQPVQEMPLTVLCPLAPHQFENKIHGYEIKRGSLAKEIQTRLPDIEFKFIPRRLSNAEMPEWYRGGNVLLNVSHAEGGPLGILEAGAGGVVPLSTVVGHVPELVIPGFNGELLSGNIVGEAVRILSEWKNTPGNLTRMQENIQTTMVSRRWMNVVKYWDDFFDRCL